MARSWFRAFLAAAVLSAGTVCVRAQEEEEVDTGVVLGDVDLAERAEIARNLFRRITPGDGELVQDAGTWPAAWEEFGAAWDGAAVEREFGAWAVPVAVSQENGATVVRDAAGRELWRGTTDFAKPESAGVVLTGALVGEEEWAGYEAVREAVEELETAGGTPAPPVRGGVTNGLRFTSVAVGTNGAVELALAWEQDGEVDIFAYGVPHDPGIRVLTWTNDENVVVTTTNTVWTQTGQNLMGYGNDWEWRGTAVVTNGEGFFADEGIPDYLSIVRFYAAAEATDTDGDGLNDGVERFVRHTDPQSQDTDGDGVPDGIDPYPAASNVFWTVTTKNAYLQRYSRPNCGQNAPAVRVATEAVVGARPTAGSVVQEVTVTGFVDDAIKVGGTGVDWRRDIHVFDHRSITNEIADLQSGQFELELWDWPRADYEGPNEARFGDTNGVPFRAEWTWKVPVEVTGPDFVCVGDTAQMGVSWADGGPYSWSVAGAAAVIDANGFLTAVTTGVATVTASNAAGWSVEKDVICTAARLTAYRPQTEAAGYGLPFLRSAIARTNQISPGVGIRINGDDDNVNGIADADETSVSGENDLIEVEIQLDPPSQEGMFAYLLKRGTTGTAVWTARTKETSVFLDGAEETSLSVGVPSMSLWVENMDGNEDDLELWVKSSSGAEVLADSLHFYPFESIVIALGGENQTPSDPADANHGVFRLAGELYRAGYDVHMYDEDNVSMTGEGAAYDEIVQAIRQRGISQVAIYGYSHGGGSTHDLAERLDNTRNDIGGFDIVFTAYIDAVAQPLALQETQRPPGSAYHVNYYQEGVSSPLSPWADYGLDGGPMDPPGADFEVNVDADGQTQTHYTIDDDDNVLQEIRSRLELRVNR